jgi:hypothetical protein
MLLAGSILGLLIRLFWAKGKTGRGALRSFGFPILRRSAAEEDPITAGQHRKAGDGGESF